MPSTVFSTFDLDQVGKLRQHHWGKHLLKRAESYENLQTFFMVGGEVYAPHHTNVCNISRL